MGYNLVAIGLAPKKTLEVAQFFFLFFFFFFLGWGVVGLFWIFVVPIKFSLSMANFNKI
jgi:hypothetical protein